MQGFNECVVFKKPSVDVSILGIRAFSFPNCHEFAIWMRDSTLCPGRYARAASHFASRRAALCCAGGTVRAGCDATAAGALCSSIVLRRPTIAYVSTKGQKQATNIQFDEIYSHTLLF